MRFRRDRLRNLARNLVLTDPVRLFEIIFEGIDFIGEPSIFEINDSTLFHKNRLENLIDNLDLIDLVRLFKVTFEGHYLGKPFYGASCRITIRKEQNTVTIHDCKIPTIHSFKANFHKAGTAIREEIHKEDVGRVAPILVNSP